MLLDADAGPGVYAVAAVNHAFDVVAVLARGPATLTNVATEAKCDKATVFRALHTLQARGLVIQEAPRGRWRLGPSWIVIARAAENQHALACTAAPHLRALAASCGHTVLLAVRDGLESTLVAAESSNLGSTMASLVGSRTPLHAGPGRLLLAYAPAAVQRSVMATRLPRYTAATHVDWSWIAADLPRIRDRGWLIATNEVQEGITTISRGVRDFTGTVVAVVTIQAPAAEVRHARAHALLTPLMDTVSSLNTLLMLFDGGRR